MFYGYFSDIVGGRNYLCYSSECLGPVGICEGSCKVESENSIVLKVGRLSANLHTINRKCVQATMLPETLNSDFEAFSIVTILCHRYFSAVTNSGKSY